MNLLSLTANEFEVRQIVIDRAPTVSVNESVAKKKWFGLGPICYVNGISTFVI